MLKSTLFKTEHAFASLIRHARRSEFKTQDQFAAAIDMSVATIAKTESTGSTHYLPDLKTAIVMGTALKIPPYKVALYWSAEKLNSAAGGDDSLESIAQSFIILSTKLDMIQEDGPASAAAWMNPPPLPITRSSS